MALDLISPRMTSKDITEGGASLVTRPSKRGLQVRRPRSKMGRAREASLGEEARTPLKGSSPSEASDPRSRMKYVSSSLGLSL